MSTDLERRRSCIGCGAKRVKQGLFRLVLDPRERPVVDVKQTALGRGAYLCGVGCLSAARQRRAFQRTFRGKMKELDFEGLEAVLAGLQQRYGKEALP